MGYPNDILASRAIIEPGKYAIIPPEGPVHNVVPGFDKVSYSDQRSTEREARYIPFAI